MLLLTAFLLQAAPTPAPPPRMVCKRMARTGSLVAGKRECKPADAWERERLATRRSVEGMTNGVAAVSEQQDQLMGFRLPSSGSLVPYN